MYTYTNYIYLEWHILIIYIMQVYKYMLTIYSSVWSFFFFLDVQKLSVMIYIIKLKKHNHLTLEEM